MLLDMKRFLTLSILLLAAVSANAGKIVTDSLYSNILKASVKYNVYLPDGFEESVKTYPVVYLLHGLGGNYTDWAKKASAKAIADELIGTGEAVEMIIVMPNAGGADRHNVWNGYFNMPGWNYEDFFFQEFVPAVESKYRGIGDKGHRAVMGLSMGGGGSTVYCQRHPDMFSSCYAMSAWLDSTVREDMEKDKFYLVNKAVREHSALDFIDKADDATLEQLRTVKWFFDCGDDDGLMDLSVALFQKMRARGLRSELRIRDGWHGWEYWHTALRLSLPFASRNFGK